MKAGMANLLKRKRQSRQKGIEDKGKDIRMRVSFFYDEGESSQFFHPLSPLLRFA